MRRLGRVLVFVMPLAASLGPIVRVGPLAVARVVGALLVALAVLAVRRRGVLPRAALWMLLVTAVWLGWGFLRLEQPAGSKELLSVGVGMFSATAMVCLAGTASGDDRDSALGWLRLYARGWLLAWFCTCLPAIWEIQSGRHLWNYQEGAAEWIRLRAKDIASYMVNPNLFAYFLTSAMVMMVVGFTLERGWLRWLNACCLLASPVIMWPTNSRLLQMIAPLFLVWAVLAWPPVWRWLRRAVPLLALAVLAVAGYIALMPGSAPKPHTGSTAQRESLYANGWWMIQHTLGFGVGPGGFEHQIDAGIAPNDPLNGPHNPHSGLFETASQYGIGVAALGIGLLLAAALLGLPVLRRRWADPVQHRLRWNLIPFAALVLPMSFANSSWLDSSVAFAQLAGLALVVNAVLANRGAPLPHTRAVALGERPPRRLARLQSRAARTAPQAAR